MDVVGHQAIAVQRDAMALATFAQVGAIGLEILFVKETRLAIVAALDDVGGNTRQKHARFAWHRYLPVPRAVKRSLFPIYFVVSKRCLKLNRPGIL
jgi:hypothetical protein